MVDRTVRVRVSANMSDFNRGMLSGAAASQTLAQRLDAADGRMAALVQSGLALAPALVPIGAAAVPAVAALTAQLGFATLAAGTTMLAFQGVGDAFKALNTYQLEPTAANLDKLNQTMAKLGPEAQHFVRYLDDLEPVLRRLRDTAAEGILPGFEDGIDSILTRLPQVRRIVNEISDAIGQNTREAGADLAGSDWNRFFRYLEHDAGPILTDFGRTMGNFVAGFSNLIVDFGPLTRDFSTGFLEMSRSFRDWTQGLDKTEGFQEFVAYIRDNGPEALRTLGALGDALLQIVEAAAPVGEIVLPILRVVADTIGVIADSPGGSVLVGLAAAIGAYGRSLALLKVVGLRGGQGVLASTLGGFAPAVRGASRALGEMTTAQDKARLSMAALNKSFIADQRVAAVRRGYVEIGRGAAVIAGLALSQSDLADKTGLANTASLALMGTLAGPWGIAIGGSIGLMQDFSAATEDAASAVDRANYALTHGATDTQLAKNLREIQVEAYNLAKADNFTRGVAFIKGTMNDLENTATDLRGALGQGEGASGDFADVLLSSLKPSLGLTAAGFDAAAQSADEFHDSLIAVNALLDKRASYRAYQQSLDDFTKSVKENRKGGLNLDLDSKEGRELQDQLDGIARSAVTVAEKLKGTNRVEFLAQARKDFLDAAEKLNISDRRARELANSLGLINTKKAKPEVDSSSVEAGKRDIDKVIDQMDTLDAKRANPRVDVDTGKSLYEVDVVRDALASLHDKTVRVHVIGDKYRQGVADGGTILGPRYPYGDKVLIAAAPGEEMISNRYGQADRFRADRAAGRIPAYGNGGEVGRYMTTTSSPVTNNYSSPIDMSQLVKRFDAYQRYTEKAMQDLAVAIAAGKPGDFQRRRR